ncbi:MarR family transcriptional regulator [Actinotalea sp.]|uniref:MarR family winged helix-turn-helix transcriptional regulator n=1 Tax=Actinotalea sp. TaxID=1872145 RepID=UPI002C6C4BB9|nr:MarR family transcriptional regulator [Actinotalea sp.]HQY34090.1 MarR family transcriptional regulator [Actinotalea sp.]HRA50969.1 MarR family transcriptional regulator [Actinotalea sp.]
MTSDTPPARPAAADCRPPALAGDLRVSVTHLVRRLRLERSSEQISDGQYATLAALANRGPMTPTALAEDQHVQPPPMTRTVNALVEAGLARRDDHPTDRRQVVVSITDAGLREVKETRRRRNAWLAAQLATLTPQEREVLATASAVLDRIATR